MSEPDQIAPEPGVLTTRIGRRFVFLFLVCALLPLVAFALLAFTHVSSQLRMETDRSLHNGAKTAGMGIAARFSQVAGDLNLVRAALGEHQGEAPSIGELGLQEFLGSRCRAIWLAERDRAVLLAGTESWSLPALNSDQLQHLAQGRPLVVVLPDRPELAMLLALDKEDPAAHCLVATLHNGWLWDVDELRIPGAEVAVYDNSHRALFHSFPELPDGAPLFAAVAQQSASGSFRWAPGGVDHLARFWRVFLRPQYGFDALVVQSRAERDAFASTFGFRRWFVMTALCTLLSVLLTALWQMRHLLEPIVRLRDATRRVALGDYSGRVEIAARDEFGDLGKAFNHMTGEIAENIRRREQTEKALVASRDEALAAVRAKAEFVTNVSHEFRTPMTEILSATEILAQADGLDDATREEFGNIAWTGARKLARLVNDVLELGSTSTWCVESIDAVTTLRNAIAAMIPEVRRRVQLEVVEPVPRVLGVGHRLTDTWIRMIDNAAKFSAAEAPIEIRVRGSATALEIDVTDRGVGISRLDLGRIFEPFLQVGRDQLTEKVHGTGLGLTIAKNTIERHGGRIEVESELGAGTTFRVTLPAQPDGVPERGWSDAQRAAAQAPQPSLHGAAQ
ncbi:MAG: HAMP domain-containing histidine kinase [Planctomycetes bacterium]|nr:HAMP domain-containing histidine kinase [Planctomycetota bacterium]